MEKKLATFPLFQATSAEQIRRLFTGATERRLRDREVLFQIGQPAERFALVTSGALKLARLSPEGSESIMHFAGAGELIGALIMPMKGAAYPASSVAIGPAAVLVIPRSTYLQWWMSDPALQSRLNFLLHHRMCQLEEAKAQQRLGLKARVAAALLHLFGTSRSKAASARRLSRQELADSVGCSVESVIRMLGELAAEGGVELDRYGLRVRNRGVLRRLAGGERLGAKRVAKKY